MILRVADRYEETLVIKLRIVKVSSIEVPKPISYENRPNC